MKNERESGGLTHGITVEVTPSEAMTLEECARGLATVSRHRRIGWFAEYVRLHTQAARVVRNLVDRAHGQSQLPLG